VVDAAAARVDALVDGAVVDEAVFDVVAPAPAAAIGKADILGDPMLGLLLALDTDPPVGAGLLFA
jgi:hypothetical protein